MAKNITLLGASYPNVPAVVLPQTGGGTAMFCERGEIEAALGSARIEKTATGGPVIRFEDGADGEPLAVQFDVTAVQSGSGDPSPSNVRPISGFDGANVGVTGKNLICKIWQGVNINNSGIISSSESYELGFGKVVQGEKYTITNTHDAFVFAFYKTLPEQGSTNTSYDGSRYVEYPKQAESHTFTAPITGFIAIRNTNGNGDTMLVSGEISATFESIGTVYPITFPASAGTVYGGTVTMNPDGTGELVVDHGGADLGSMSWTKYKGEGYADLYYTDDLIAQVGATDGNLTHGICSSFILVDDANHKGIDGSDTAQPYNSIRFRSANGRIYLKIAGYSSASELTQALSGVLLVYELHNPVTYSLSPGQVLSLLGQNNVWADTGDMTTVTYFADLQAILDGIVS